MPKVLIADDAPTIRLYCRQILESAGFQVEEGINGLEAMEKALLDHFDLVVTDVNMPKMDGYALLSEVRRSPQLRPTPAVVISTEAQQSDRVRAYAAGANAYLVKPLKPDELTTIAKLLTGVPVGREPGP